MKRFLMILGLVLAFSLFATGSVLAQDPDQNTATTGEVAVLLAPLLAAATAIERIIEVIFDRYESVILSMQKFPDQAKDYLSWARKEVEKFQKLLMDKQQNTDQVDMAFEDIEEQLQAAKDRLEDYLDSPQYTSWKKTVSLVTGLVLGLLIAIGTGLQMFALLGVDVRAPWIDVIVTGLIIGTGSAPVHALIGLLQNAKNAVDQARALWQGKAYSTQAEAMIKAQSEILKTQAAQQEREIQRLRQLVEAQVQSDEEAAISFDILGIPEIESTEETMSAEVEFAPQTQALVDNRKFQRRVKGMLR